MSKIDEGGLAFPRPYSSAGNGNFANPQSGMTLRGWLSGQALGGIMAGWGHLQPANGREVGRLAVEAADAVIAALKEPRT